MGSVLSTPSRFRPGVLILCIGILAALAGQASAQSISAQTAVPQLLPVTGTLVAVDGKPLTGTIGITFAIYEEAEGGVPLWIETQAVTLDERGRFTAWVGTQGEGLPLDLFQTGLARWMGVQASGLPEQPRVRFLAVPYALKAMDAETLGGLPASAFVSAAQPGARAGAGAAAATATLPKSVDPNTSATGGRDSGGITADVVHADDVIITGHLCVGADCVSGESFLVADGVIKLKANNLRIQFEDTSTAIGFPTNDWQVTVNADTSGGANYFAIADVTGNKVPFLIEAGAATNALYVDSSARIGLNTSNPLLELHLVDGDTPGVRLDQDGSSGWTPQVWDLAGNESNFFIRDVTNGSKLPFRIQPGAPSSTLNLKSDGKVGIGTWSPTHTLTVEGSVAASGSYLLGAGAYGLRHSGGIVMFDGGSDYPDGYRFATGGQPSGAMEILDNGNIGIGIAAPVQPLHVFGNIRTDATFLFGSGYGMRATGGVVRFDGGTNYPEGYSFATSGLPSGAVTITATGEMGLNVLAPTYPLEHASGAHLTAGGVWTNASSRALKERIVPLTVEAAEAALAALQPVTYVYKADPGDPQVGFIAEDVPELVATADRTSLAPMDIVAVLTKVAQQQAERLRSQQDRIAAQTAELAELRARLAEVERLLLGRQR